MKKRNITSLWWVLALALALLFSAMGCQTNAPSVDRATFRVASNNGPVICGELKVFTLWGGKTINVGTVTVSNDNENLYVTYATTGGWWINEVQLHVLDYEPTERLNPGHAPYKSGILNPRQTSYEFTIPLSELAQKLKITVTCGETTLWLQAHAAVVKVVDDQVVQSETAYGGDITADANPWYGNISYKVQCCSQDEPGEYACYEDETAWAAGTRYVKKGNWATYTQYDGVTKEVTLYAGQTMNAGTVKFEPDNGNVLITITLNSGWRFDPDEENNVKIQDYASPPPAKNPAPGKFAWKAKATRSPFQIVVPKNNYYGVHVDVEREVPCE